MEIILFFGVPILALIFFLVSLIMYLLRRKQNKTAPEGVPPEKNRFWRIMLIVSAILFAVLLSMMIGIMIVISRAVVNM